MLQLTVFLFLTAFSFSALCDDTSAALEHLSQADQSQSSTPDHGTAWYRSADSRKTVIIFHGLHESPFFMRNWVQFFLERDYNVLNVRLPGHFDKGGRGLKTVRSQQWVQAADQAFRLVTQDQSLVSDEISVFGFSTGGTLAAYLALQHAEIKNVFLLSPAFALSRQVYFMSTILNPTGISTLEICKNKSSFICRRAMQADPDFAMMVNNGMEISPQGGAQVQALINFVFQIQPQQSNDSPNYRTQIFNKLNQINGRIVMANTAVDKVIDANLNQTWITQFQGKKLSVFFPAADRISHIVMNKNQATRFHHTTSGYNKNYDQVTQLFDQAILGQ